MQLSTLKPHSLPWPVLDLLLLMQVCPWAVWLLVQSLRGPGTNLSEPALYLIRYSYLFLLFIWSIQRYPTVTQLESKKGALASAVLAAMVATVLAGAGAIITTLGTATSEAAIVGETHSWFWYCWVGFAMLAGAVYGAFLIRKAMRGPWGQPAPIAQVAWEEKLHELRSSNDALQKHHEQLQRDLERFLRDGEPVRQRLEEENRMLRRAVDELRAELRAKATGREDQG
jgi:hypothetical protein